MDVKTLAIKKAHMLGTLTLTEHKSRRFNEEYVIIGDHRGMIETALDMTEAEDRIKSVCGD